MTTTGYVARERAAPQITRKQFLEYAFLKGPLCAWWFRNLEESPPLTKPDYKFLNGGCLIANHHEFLFTTHLLWEQLEYYKIMGAKVIRAMATDANHLIPRQLNGFEVGARITLLAPALRLNDIKLIIAFTNNHCPVPGDEKYAGNTPQVGDPTKVYYEILEPWYEGGYKENYLPFVKALITTVHRFGAQDVIFAWEPGNELHTPLNPEKFLSFYREATAFIKDLDPETILASGTMGMNHIDPGNPSSEVAEAVYELEESDIITLHSYDFLLERDGSTGEHDRPVSAGDMPIDWDFELFKTMNLDKPVVMEEIGTSRILAPRWHNPDEPTRLAYEAGLIDYALRNGAVGWGPWSLTTQAERIGDGWRGPCSYPGMSLYETGGQPTDSPRARIEECYRSLPHPALSTLREKFPHLKI
jgi:endo-1,4-beta-mannosidase